MPADIALPECSGQGRQQGTHHMREAIKRLLGLQTKAGGHPDPAAQQAAMASMTGNRDSQTPPEDNTDFGIRSQLVQMLLRESLREHGMAPGWVECQILLMNSRTRGQGIFLRLVMPQWDPRLLTYAFAFQNKLLAAVTQFDPQAATWLHGVSWEFNVGNTCPYPDMPDPAVWREPAKATALEPAPPDADDDVLRDLKDLQSMFAARDTRIEQEAASGTQADFQPTQPTHRMG